MNSLSTFSFDYNYFMSIVLELDVLKNPLNSKSIVSGLIGPYEMVCCDTIQERIVD